MPVARLFVRSVPLLLAIAALSACAQHEGTTLPATPLAVQNSVGVPNATATPPPCKGQKNGKTFASLNVTLSSKGGAFCVPAIGGFGGTISYPKAKPAVKVALISSSTNYKKLPELGTGTAIFYLQMTLATGTTFGNAIRPTGGLTAATISSGKPYTVYGQATVSGQKITFGPCYSVATKGKYGGVVGAIGALLEYGAVPTKAAGFLEVYSGKQTATQC
ncbi:MAG TPA: hypothetical protein VHX17_01405 [Candidatus Cybelea sp.]|jgi:hypothetical protein|nr:hypothetical protein [Candidatus Cybelea sp.]